MRQKSFFDASLKNNPCASEVQFGVIILKRRKKKRNWTAACSGCLTTALISLVPLILEKSNKCSCLQVFWEAIKGEKGVPAFQREVGGLLIL